MRYRITVAGSSCPLEPRRPPRPRLRPEKRRPRRRHRQGRLLARAGRGRRDPPLPLPQDRRAPRYPRGPVVLPRPGPGRGRAGKGRHARPGPGRSPRPPRRSPPSARGLLAEDGAAPVRAGPSSSPAAAGRPSSTAPTSWPRSWASGSSSRATSSPTGPIDAPRPRPRRDGPPALRRPRHPALPRFPRGPGLVDPRELQGHPGPAPQAPDELLRPPHLPREPQQGKGRDAERRAHGLDRPRGRFRRGRKVVASYPASYQNTARGQLGLRGQEDRRFPFRRGAPLRARRFRQRRDGRLQPRPGDRRGLERGLRPGRGRLPRRLHPGPPPRRQDLRRDGDAADRPRPRQEAPGRLRPRPQGPGRRQGPLSRRCSSGSPRPIPSIITGSGPGKAGPGTTPRPRRSRP